MLNTFAVFPLIYNLFQITKGDRVLNKSEITENTYVKLRTPAFILLVSGIISITLSMAAFIFLVKNLATDVENRITSTEYRLDRVKDSLALSQYRKETSVLLERIIIKQESYLKKKE